jgi:VWFA-related protein
MRIPAPLVAGLLAAAMTVPAAGQAPPGQQPNPTPPAQPAAQDPTPQQQPERAQQPPLRSGINFVRVDVIVTDKQGNPVLDLKPEEFTVAEDGKPQSVQSFSVVKIDQVAQLEVDPPAEIRTLDQELREAARPDVRLFVLLLDDYHVRRGNDMAVRKPLIEFIQTQLAPADMVAIMYPLTSVTELHFSRNHDSLVRAIEKFEGRKFDYLPRNQFEEQYAYYPAATVERIRNQVTMGALKGAAVRMGGLREGRKSIIFVSEGFTSTLPPQLNDPVAAMPRVGNTARNNPGLTTSDTAEFFNSTDLLSDMREVFDTANRQNTSIYAVDPRGLAAFAYDINEGVGPTTDSKHLTATVDTLRILADNTDGRAIVNRNDLATGMKQIVRDASGYYLLGYSSSQAPTDGKFHEIKVRVTRRGLDVRARKGYWAYTTEDVARASAPPAPEAPTAVTAALSSIAEPSRGRPARFWVGTSRGDSGASRVTFAWEPIAQQPAGAASQGAPERAAARVLLTATAPDGRPLFRKRVPEEGNSAAAQVVSPAPAAGATSTAGSTPRPAASAGGTATFDVPPGQVQLRMVVEDDRGQVMDSATQELTVPDFTKVEVSLSSPRVYRARTVREIQALKGAATTAPTAERSFSRADRMLVRVDAYAPGNDVPAITARLLNRAGQAMSDVPVQSGQPGQGDIELGLSSLAAGDYLIEINAKTSSGTAQQLVAFKISR